MTTLRFHRTSEYNNMLRDFKIYLDGKHIGNIANGETADFVIEAGKHIVITKIDWCMSPEVLIDIHENEIISLKTGGFLHGRFIMILSLIIIALHFVLTTLADFNYLIFLVLPIFLLQIYYITVGRKKYLILKKTSMNSPISSI